MASGDLTGPGPEIAHDHAPHSSDDRSWTDTWYWSSIDRETQQAFWVHVSWLPALNRGQHVVTHVKRDGTRQLRELTTSPFSSELLSVEPIEPWWSVRLRCPGLGLDARWSAFSPPVDFRRHMHVSSELRLSHYQGGGGSSGLLGESAFEGRGLRDRSFGPRNLRNIGRNWAVTAVGVDESLFLTANVMWPNGARFSDPPDINFGCLWRSGDVSTFDGGLVMLRRRDGSPGSLRIAGGPTVDLAMAERYGESRFVFDPNSAPVEELSPEPVYGMTSSYVPLDSKDLGSLVGWYAEGVLWP